MKNNQDVEKRDNKRAGERISLRKLVSLSPLFFPVLVSAQGTFGTTIQNFIQYAAAAINFLLILATLVFLWGIVKYVSAGGDATKTKEAKTYILWGIVGLAIMGSVWALVRFIRTNIGGGIEQEQQQIPTYGVPGN